MLLFWWSWFIIICYYLWRPRLLRSFLRCMRTQTLSTRYAAVWFFVNYSMLSVFNVFDGLFTYTCQSSLSTFLYSHKNPTGVYMLSWVPVVSRHSLLLPDVAFCSIGALWVWLKTGPKAPLAENSDKSAVDVNLSYILFVSFLTAVSRHSFHSKWTLCFCRSLHL